MNVCAVIFVLVSLWDFGISLSCYKCNNTMQQNCLSLEETVCSSNPPIYEDMLTEKSAASDNVILSQESTMSDVKCVTAKTNSSGKLDRGCLWATPGLSPTQICGLLERNYNVQLSYCSICENDLCNDDDPVDMQPPPASELKCFSCSDPSDATCSEYRKIECPGEDPLGETSFWDNNDVSVPKSVMADDVNRRFSNTQVRCLTAKVYYNGVDHVRRGCVYSLPGSSDSSTCKHLDKELEDKLVFCSVCKGDLCNAGSTKTPACIFLTLTVFLYHLL